MVTTLPYRLARIERTGVADFGTAKCAGEDCELCDRGEVEGDKEGL